MAIGPPDIGPLEYRFRRAMTDSSIGLCVVEPDGRFRTVNPALCDLLGYDEPTLITLSWQDLTHPDDLAADAALALRVIDGEIDRYRINKRYLHADGRVIYAELSVSGFRAEDGTFSYFVSQIVDQSARTLATDALKRSEELHRGLVAALGEGVIVQDTELRIVAANPAVERILGVPRDELMGWRSGDPRWVMRHLDGTIMPVEEHPGAAALRDGAARRDVLLGMDRADGEGIWVLVNSELLRDPSGAPTGVVSSFTDVTDHERVRRLLEDFTGELERRVAERTAQLEALNEELRIFGSAVSHDLRAPARAIASFAGLMLRQDAAGLEERGLRRLENIVEAGTTMGRLIDDLAAYTRIGQGALRRQPVAVGPVVARLRVLLAQRLEETGGTLAVAEGGPVPLADPTLLERVLLNLVDNALTYHRPGVPPVVSVSARRNDSQVVVSVSDNGEGIPATAQDKVFQVFTRIRTDADPDHTGTGLATVRRSARAMGGEVTFTSQPGAGTEFRVWLPSA